MIRTARVITLAALIVRLEPAAAAEEPAQETKVPPEAPKKKPPMGWPLWTMHALPPGAEVPLGPSEALVQMEVEPRGNYLVMAVRPKGSRSTLRLWDFNSGPTVLKAPDLRERSIESLAFSAFDATLFVASMGQAPNSGYEIDRFAVDAQRKTLKKLSTVFSSQHRIASLVTGLVEYDGQERLYFGLEYAPDRFQMLGTRGDGTGVYELTSPTGSASELTEEQIRLHRGDESIEAPTIQKTESALPLSLGPDGILIWRDGSGALEEQSYAMNWRPATAVPGGSKDVDEVLLANGYFRERWTAGRPGFELVNRKHGRTEPIAADVTFVSRPIVATSGRSFVGAVRTGAGTSIKAFAMPSRGAAIRIHSQVWDTKENTLRLERDGIMLIPTDADQIYNIYERLAYQDLGCGENGGMYQSVFASLDGFFEVLNAGFEAVFVLAEQKASRPALTALLKELRRVAKAGAQKRLADIADAVTKTLAGSLKHPEGELIKAGRSAPSALPINLDGEKLDYSDFLPRGPYVATKALSSYFRAFKLLNHLQLKPDEQALLAGDPGFMAALRKWVDVQRPFLAGTRHPTLFDVGAKPSDVPAACVPERVRKTPPLLYPLAWSMDSEILEGSVERLGVGADCGSVPGRTLPTGLDLLAGLGGRKARSLNAPEYKKFPALEQSQLSAERRSAVLAKAATFVDSYLRMIQMLSTDVRAPEAVSPDLWQRRLMQSALGAWVGLRHTLVLVSERGDAECDNERQLFELLQAEPARGAVDPLPDAWKQIGALLDLLAEHARQQRVASGLTSHLHEQAGIARKFGAMADRQMRQEPLGIAEYQLIEAFAGAVEHPYLLFKSVLQHGEPGEIPVPEPMAKIVDIQRGSNGEIWHAAIGHPLEATILLGDRGVLVPATGGVYSYYEVTAAAPLDDKAWREQLGAAKSPAWVTPLLQGPRPRPPSASPPP
jgi:Protein of unknown function (DUF3160)